MGNRSPKLALSFMVIASLCLEVVLLGLRIKSSVNMRSWSEARLYCQKNHIDLFTKNIVNVSTLSKWMKVNKVDKVWIGLHRDNGNVWKWINERSGEGLSGDDFSQKSSWPANETDTGDCAYVDRRNDQWSSAECSTKMKFLCYDDEMEVVKEKKPWEEALRHCRGIGTQCTTPTGTCRPSHDILSVQNWHASYVKDRVYNDTKEELWIGGRYLGHEWLTANDKRLDTTWLPQCPSLSHRCLVLASDDKINWIAKDCTEKRHFICYKRKQ